MAKKSTKITNDFCPQTLFLYGVYKEDGTPNFGLFCWFSYIWDKELGVMACIGGEKLTKDRIKATNVFSANLVTEEMLPMADYLGIKNGYDKDKMDFTLEVEKGEVLNVPTLACSPVTFELEVFKSVPLDDGEVFLCKIRNLQMDEKLIGKDKTQEELMRSIAPISTTCETYYSWVGKELGKWGGPQQTFL